MIFDRKMMVFSLGSLIQKGVKPTTDRLFRSKALLPAWWQAIMELAALSFLVLLGLLLPHGEVTEWVHSEVFAQSWLFEGLRFLWWFIFAESVLGLSVAKDAWSSRLQRLLLIGLVPPLRMTLATAVRNGRIWVSGLGWLRRSLKTSMHVERRLAVPMIAITLLVIPVLVCEFFFEEQVGRSPILSISLHLMTCVVWLGFTLEFMWMTAATTQPMRYVTRHWIHLLIILLPMLALLRFLRAFQFVRLLRAGKMLRMYRLRGLSMRLWRAALLFNVIENIIRRRPEAYKQSLQRRAQELQRELNEVQQKLKLLDQAEAAALHKEPTGADS